MITYSPINYWRISVLLILSSHVYMIIIIMVV